MGDVVLLQDFRILYLQGFSPALKVEEFVHASNWPFIYSDKVSKCDGGFYEKLRKLLHYHHSLDLQVKELQRLTEIPSGLHM